MLTTLIGGVRRPRLDAFFGIRLVLLGASLSMLASFDVRGETVASSDDVLERVLINLKVDPFGWKINTWADTVAADPPVLPYLWVAASARGTIVRIATAIAGTSVIYNHYQIKRKSSVVDSLVAGGWPGEGNLDTNPLFVDAANGDYRLRSDSPCRNRGSNAHLPPDLADLSNDGNRSETLPRDIILRGRIEGTAVDMGAFEWHP